MGVRLVDYYRACTNACCVHEHPLYTQASTSCTSICCVHGHLLCARTPCWVWECLTHACICGALSCHSRDESLEDMAPHLKLNIDLGLPGWALHLEALEWSREDTYSLHLIHLMHF